MIDFTNPDGIVFFHNKPLSNCNYIWNCLQTIPDVITIGQRFIMEKYNSVRVGKIYHYHNPRDIGTSGHDDHFTWDQTVNPYGRDKIEEYKLNKVKENFDGLRQNFL